MTDFEWFVENYEEFQKKYGNCHIVIKDKKILGVYDNISDAFSVTLQTEQIGSFIIQECNVYRKTYIVEIPYRYF